MRHGPPFCRPRRGYHHGSLKETLLEAARRLVGERGPSGFTLADAAKFAGVTPAALYRHFADRSDLLAELRQRGFTLFTQRLKGAWDDGRPDPRTAMERMGRAYQDFARDEPGLYAAMFGQTMRFQPSESAHESLVLLEQAALAVLRQFGLERKEARALALQIWAISHGVSTLVQAGQFSSGISPVSGEALINDAIAALFQAELRRGPASAAPQPAA